MTDNLRKLDLKVKAVRMEAFAPNTRRTRASQWRVYESFCEEYGLSCFPINSENTCRFLVWKSSTVSYVTLNNYVSALNVVLKINGSKDDLREDYAVHLTLRGLRRLLGDAATPMDALLPRDLLKIKSQVNFVSMLERAVWVGILLAFRTLLRKSHFFCDEGESVHLLARSELSWQPWGLKITISRSKTIQYGQRKYECPVNFCGGPLCAVSALRDYWRLCPDSPHAPLLSNGKGAPVQYRAALGLLKKWSSKSGVGKTVGLHSLRRGMATHMKNMGFSLLDIQAAGDWQSLAVLRYLSTSAERRKDIDLTIASSLPK